MPADTITGVDFVTVPTADLAASVAFYGDVLGLHRSVHMPERGFAEFETGNLTLSIIVPEKMGMEPYVTPNPIALHVEDMEAARGDLETAGVTFEGETFDTGVCHMAFFRDPHGNPLMLHHRYAPRTTE
jgi:catechol 2,3-dioxygenase-like lactoylglutathione lyase family enzyme